MRAIRVLLIAAGLISVVYGAVLVFDLPTRTILLMALWAGGGVVVHDFVFAPLAAALGYTGRRLIKGAWWSPVAVAALCTATLLLLAVPVFDTPGAKPDNPTVLDRDYPMGLLVAVSVVWAPALFSIAVGAVRRRRPAHQDSPDSQVGR